jgi:hypothetical protein
MVIALLMLALGAVPALAAEPVRVAASVSANDKAVAEKLAGAVNAELSKATGYLVVDKLPQATLVLYANRDVNSLKNPDGWSISVIHVSNVDTYFLASKLLQSQQSDAVAVQPMLNQMLSQPGFVTHVNVAHFDEMSDANLAAVAHRVVADFLAKIPKQAG